MSSQQMFQFFDVLVVYWQIDSCMKHVFDFFYCGHAFVLFVEQTKHVFGLLLGSCVDPNTERDFFGFFQLNCRTVSDVFEHSL